MSDSLSRYDGYPLATDQTEKVLTEKQLVDYKAQREQFVEWLAQRGKDVKKWEGYSDRSIIDTAYRTDRFYRWFWSENGGYTLSLTIQDAEDYMVHIAKKDVSQDTKATDYRAVRRLYKWLHHEHDMEEWDEPDLAFYNSGAGLSQPRDYLSIDERRMIREAALEYGDIPKYNDLSPDERHRWKGHLANKLNKPKEQVKPSDWKELTGWKFTTITWVSLDAGLRPIEVGRAKTSWVDLKNKILRIPREESTKNDGHWEVALTDRTIRGLEHWLSERKTYPRYDDTDALWLTRESNPYNHSSLRRLMHKLFDIAGIEKRNRQVSWYSIRHSVGTHMNQTQGLKAAQMQLRHKNPETTMRYVNSSNAERRDGLDRMG